MSSRGRLRRCSRAARSASSASYHGRAAGLRTYALVCFGSALLVAAAQYEFSSTHGGGEVTRVIQGIVTGIGFLGAGVIVKEGFTVRGLTTSASIWVASAIGVVIGAGSYLTGAEASVVTLIALAMFRRLEDRCPRSRIVHFEVGFDARRRWTKNGSGELIRSHGFAMRELSSQLRTHPQLLEYRAIIWSNQPGGIKALEQSLWRSRRSSTSGSHPAGTDRRSFTRGPTGANDLRNS